MTRSFELGPRLRYPFAITKILKRPGATVAKKEPLFEFRFEWVTEVLDSVLHEVREHVERGFGVWESPGEGILREWHVKEGDTIRRDQKAIVIEESCDHAVQFEGMCAKCGKDMTEVSWVSDKADTQRATINMTHDQTRLLVSGDVAKSTDSDTKRRLLKQRKLILVVDLDQTIIHACTDPTVADWRTDPENPNYEAVKDVQDFKLDDGTGPRGIASGCSYFIKVRPGCREFLEDVATMYELHIYTMATRAYAKNIAKIVDPTGKLFGNRIISRDENQARSKSLHRLFPVSTNMVVIIDDRSDMWPKDRNNLIKVMPYEFFTGIGDINSSFLPKRTDLLPDAPPVEDSSTPNGKGQATTTAEGESDDKLQEEQDKMLEKQITERPLQHLQEELDKAESEGGTADVDMNGEQTPQAATQQHHHKHNILKNNDEELVYLQDHLTKVHAKYFRDYDSKCKKTKREDPRSGGGDVNIDIAPNVGHFLTDLKKTVLEGANIVFSGFFPMGVDPSDSDLGLSTLSFGAQLHRDITHLTTHLIVSTQRPRTHKVYQASKKPYIKIVNQHWLYDSMSQWRWLDERKYQIQVNPTDRRKLSTVDADGRPTDMVLDGADAKADGDDDGDGEGEDDDDDGPSNPVDEFNEIDWDEVDDELKELLTSDEDDDDDDDDKDDDDDDDDNDNDNDTSDDKKDADADADGSSEDKDDGPDQESHTVRRTTPMRGTKRKATNEGDGEEGTPSPSSSRKRRAGVSRGGSPGAQLPHSQEVQEVQELQLRGQSQSLEEEEDEGDDGLEAALMAEFEDATVDGDGDGGARNSDDEVDSEEE